MSKIVAYYNGRFVTVYNVNGDFDKIYRGIETKDCRAITSHEITKKDKIGINTDKYCNTTHVCITRGVKDTSIVTYYVDEIWMLSAGQRMNVTNDKRTITY